MTMVDPRFTPLLSELQRHDLDTDPASVFGVWADGRLAYANPGWFRFAAENGGEPVITTQWGLGCPVVTAIQPRLRPFYEAHYRAALLSDRPVSHLYECSTPDRFRRMQQILYPLGKGDGLLVVNTVVVENPHVPAERLTRSAVDDGYRDPAGFVHQCGHCRRVRNFEGQRWDWVPDWVVHPPPLTRMPLCPPCEHHYRGDGPASRQRGMRVRSAPGRCRAGGTARPGR